MTEKMESIPNYDWNELRNWCLWYARVFLQFSKIEDKSAYDWFQHQVEGRQLDWKKVEKIKDISIRYIIETITSYVSEAVETREALPGDFSDSVAVLQGAECVLQKDLTPETTLLEIQKYER
jgi:hypothetical protein